MRFKKPLIFTLIFTLLLLSLVSPQTAHAAGSWNGLGSLGSATSDSAIAFIGSTPYVAYLEGTNVKVGKYNGSGWTDISPSGINNSDTFSIQLVADSASLYLSYESMDGMAFLMKCVNPGTSPSWLKLNTPVLDDIRSGIFNTRLASNNGVVYMALYTGDSIYVLQYNGSLTMLGNAKAADIVYDGSDCNIGLAVYNNIPYVAYREPHGNCYVKHYVSGGWTTDLSTSSISYIQQIAFGSDGTLYACCTISGNSALYVKNGSNAKQYALPSSSGESLDADMYVFCDNVFIDVQAASSGMYSTCYYRVDPNRNVTVLKSPGPTYMGSALLGSVPYISYTNGSGTTVEKYDSSCSAPLAANIAIVNNPVVTQDTVTVSGLSSGDCVYVFSDSGETTLLGSAAATYLSATVSIPQLGHTSGTVYVTRTSGTAWMSPATSVAYAAESYSVSFDAGGKATDPTAITVTYGGTYSNLPAVSADGYTFNGWYTEAGDKGTKVTASTSVAITANQTLYAHWIAKTYTVSFDARGKGTAPSAITVTYGGTYGTLPDISADGYNFDGWYTAASGGDNVTASTSVAITANQTLYAHWSGNAYTVSFDTGGIAANPTSITVTYGGTYGTLPDVSADGYSFDGWYTASSGGDKVTSATAVAITKDQKLYAHWTANAYTVSFDAQGGTVGTSSKSVTYGSSYGALPSATRTGFTFGGWYTAKSGGGTQITASSTVSVTANQTIYAKWIAEVKYTIAASSSNKSYGSVLGAGSYGLGTSCTLTATPASLCRFVNWLEGGKAVSGAGATYKFTVSKARTLQAVFAKIGTPTLSSVKAIGGKKIKLTWKAVSGAKGYVIYRAASKSGKYTEIKRVSGSLTFTDANRTKGKTCYYKIKAYCVAGVTTYGPYSKIGSAKAR